MNFGVLNLCKPAGCTSRDVVNRVQRLVRPEKAGHAGTLDPLATGVLVVCIGPATRLLDYVQRQTKRYRATYLLGQVSDTEDVEGTVQPLEDAPLPTRDQLQAALPRFVGRIQQRPPAYSALKLHGRRAHQLARQGRAVDLSPRPVEIYDLAIAAYDFPRLVLEVACGSGTYVRSLGRDLAEAVGSGAVMEQLTRTAVGGFTIEHSVHPEQLDGDSLPRYLLDPLLTVADLPQVRIGRAEFAKLLRGQLLRLEQPPAAAELAAVDSRGRLAAILKPHGAGLWKPAPNFALSFGE